MDCPACVDGELNAETRDLPYVYQGEATVIAGVRCEFCPACGETVLAAEESSRVSAAMLELNRKVKAASVDPQFFASMRKRVALDQTDLLGEVKAA